MGSQERVRIRLASVAAVDQQEEEGVCQCIRLLAPRPIFKAAGACARASTTDREAVRQEAARVGGGGEGEEEMWKR